MNNVKALVLFALLFLVAEDHIRAQSMGLNNAAPDASSILDATATNRGILIPRVALTATNAVGPIASPADALLVYNTATAGGAGVNVTPGFYYYSTGASAWIRIFSGGGSPGPRWDHLLDPGNALTLSHSTHATVFNFANVGTTGFAMNATAMTTGSLLALASSNAAATGNVLSVTTNSTGVPVSGLVRFNFNGARSAAGNAFQIDDISTTLATTMQLNANSLTTGKGLSVTTNGITTGNGILVSSSSTGITSGALLQLNSTGAIGNASGSVLNVNSTGVNTNGYLTTIVGNSIAAGGLFNASTSSAASTGTLFRVASTGASTGAVGMFSNAGSGLSLRINDDGTDADASPVVVDAGGNLGIGTAAPVRQFDIHGGAGPAYLMLHNNASGAATTDGFELSLGAGPEVWFWNYENAFMSFGTNNAERMVIAAAGNIGIGQTAPDASSILDIVSTTKGILIPRVTTAQRTAIAAPVNGLFVFDTDLRTFYYYDTPAAVWRSLYSSLTPAAVDWNIAGNAGIIDGTDYIGTNGAVDLDFRTNATERMTIDGATGNVGIGVVAPATLLDVQGNAQIGVNGTTLTNIIKVTITQDIGNCGAAGNLVETFTVANAAVGSSVIISPQTALTNGLLIAYARVSVAGTVEVKFRNATFGAINMASMDWYITVIE